MDERARFNGRNPSDMVSGREVRRVLALSLLASVLTSCGAGANVDITVFLKEVNQDIAPLALSCPDWNYPQQAVVECRFEFQGRYQRTLVQVSRDGVEFVEPEAIQRAREELGADSTIAPPP